MPVFTLKFAVPETHAGLFKSCDLMVTALAPPEVPELRDLLDASGQFGVLVARTLTTLAQVLESPGDKEAHIERTLAMLREPSQVIVAINDRIRELLGRALLAKLTGDDNDHRGTLQ